MNTRPASLLTRFALGVALAFSCLASSRAGTFSTVHAFSGNLQGITPYAYLIQGSDGRLYGTTFNQGDNGAGTVFAVATDGTGYTVLHSFVSATDGGFPSAGLIQGSDGRLYGTTFNGGANGDGTVFALEIDGTGFTVLFNMDSAIEGANSSAGLIEGVDGRLYGVARAGGAHGDGTVFSLATDGTDFVVLHDFSSASDGATAAAGLIQGSDNRLYGTASAGGANSWGTVFALATDGTGFTVLHDFASATDGDTPVASLIQGNDDRLYGTASGGGANGSGTIFALAADGTGFTVLRDLTSGTDGDTPYGRLLQGSDDRLYGTAKGGGAHFDGTVFAIATDGTGFTVLRDLTSASDGGAPYAGLTTGLDGLLYGTASAGGTNGQGTVFAMAENGTGFTVLSNLAYAKDGANPFAGLVQGADGRLYGTTYAGGTAGNGTAYAVATDGTGYTILHSFVSASDGAQPSPTLVQGDDGRLYGTTRSGGANGDGTVFAVEADGTGFVVLHDFTSASDGAPPYAGLIQGIDGRLYGTTNSGGSNGFGTVFALATDGTGFVVLRNFDDTNDGRNPWGGLLQGSDGRLYGTTSGGGANTNGTVYAVTTDGGTFTVLYNLSAGTDGASPYSKLIQGADDRLYGTSSTAGANGDGTVFALETDGSNFTVLHAFTSASDGGQPYGGVTQGVDGLLYGTTYMGGANGDGTLFAVTTDGATFTVLHDLAHATDGSSSRAGVIQASDGEIFGTTSLDGVYGFGTIFAYSDTPAVDSISPTTGTALGGTSVVITGSGFTGATAVKFGTVAATGFTVDSDTQITATSPAGTGTVDVTVVRLGTSPISPADEFTYFESSNANLSNLTINPGTLKPSFAANRQTYFADLPGGTTSVTVTPTVDDSESTVTVNGVPVSSGDPSDPIAFGSGSTTISVMVTAGDGVTSKLYLISLGSTPVVGSPTATGITTTTATIGGTVSFDGNKRITRRGIVYSLTSDNADPRNKDRSVTTVIVSGTTGSLTKKLTRLQPGSTYSYAIFATNHAGTTYSSVGTFTTAAASTDAKLTNLVLSTGTLSPAFASGTTEYTATVASDVTSVTVTPTAASSAARIHIGGAAVASGSASDAITLATGDTRIRVRVVAEDGETVRVYVITVTRSAP
ncbi:MAG TPA: choice-of-anchor tandem repeat GloVer-containing protein [Opitutus sp.]|nr:choice-of-anchor tandem repeat GloVer-containing protein [Opitutus sp.]